MKSKRILKIVVRHLLDESPDTSYFGEYGPRAKNDYAIDRAHSQECPSLEENHRTIVDQLERAIQYLEKERTAEGAKEDSVLWEPLDEAEDILIQAQEDVQECDCGFSGHWDNREYRYFNGNVENYKGESPEDIRKYVRQDYERMESLNNGNWQYIGIRALAEIALPSERFPDSSVIQEIESGGLWGIESDSGQEHLDSITKEELAELRTQLLALGFSKRAISTAFKNVEYREQ